MACKQNLDLRCVLISDPGTLGARAKTRLESRTKKFTPHYICRMKKFTPHFICRIEEVYVPLYFHCIFIVFSGQPDAAAHDAAHPRASTSHISIYISIYTPPLLPTHSPSTPRPRPYYPPRTIAPHRFQNCGQQSRFEMRSAPSTNGWCPVVLGARTWLAFRICTKKWLTV